MTQCFKDHDCDTKELHKNTKSISACENSTTEENGKKVRNFKVPVLTCECIWRTFQEEAEEIVAPGGTLIADPKERNKRINAAYAKLWLNDHRFQWAGLAAFASKQVGCGLMHASESMKKIQAEHDAVDRMDKTAKPVWDLKGWFGWIKTSKLDEKAVREYEQARGKNPVPTADIRTDGEKLSLMQQQYQHVYDMLALGNTSLFLDVFPLHAFYKKRGFKELEACIASRAKIATNPKYPILWPVEEKLKFSVKTVEVLKAFEAIETGKIAKSVEHLAQHEQVNILQKAMYSDPQFVLLLRSNHVSYVTGIPSGVAEAIQLTLASQCSRVEGRTISIGNNPIADLSDVNQRMPFVLKAAARFDELLHSANRSLVEQSIQDIANGGGVR